MAVIDYAMAQREMPRLKAALTRAKKSGDPEKVLAAVQAAYARFDAWGAWPDNWRLWESAERDARLDQRRHPALQRRMWRA